jgi:hypothetical protein
MCTTIRDWTIAQIPGGAMDLDQLVYDGKTLRGSIEPTAAGGSAFIAQVSDDNLVEVRFASKTCCPF